MGVEWSVGEAGPSLSRLVALGPTVEADLCLSGKRVFVGQIPHPGSGANYAKQQCKSNVEIKECACVRTSVPSAPADRID